MKRIMALAIIAVMTLTLALTASAAAPGSVKYDAASGKITGLSTGLVYSTNSGSTWITIDQTMILNGITVTADVTYWFAFTSTAESDRKNAGNYTAIGPISAGGTAPVISGIKYDNGKLTGLDKSWEYYVTSSDSGTASATGWTSVPSVGYITIARKADPQYIWFRFKATSTATASSAVKYTLTGESKSDLTGLVSVNYNTEKFVITSGSWIINAISATYSGSFDSTLTGSTTAYPDMTYYIRAANDTVGTALKTPKRPAAPSGMTYSVSTTSDTVTIGGVSGTMKYRTREVDSGISSVWTDVTGTSFTVTQSNKWQYIDVAYKATSTAYSSFNATLLLWPKPVSDPSLNNVRYQGGALMGLTADMEYQVVDKPATGSAVYDDDNWKACSAGKLEVNRTDKDQVAFIQMKGNTDASKVASFDIPLKLPPPALTLDLPNGIIYGFDPTQEYQYKTASWKDITSTDLTSVTVGGVEVLAFDISPLLKGKALTISFAIKPSSGKPESDSITNIEIKAGPDKEKMAVNKYITPAGGISLAEIMVSEGTQYKLDTDDTWVDVPDGTDSVLLPAGYTAATYLFRIGATDTAQSSPESKLKLAAIPSAPNVKVDYKKEIITIKGGQSYSLDGTVWNAVSKGGKLALDLAANNLYGCTIYVRTTETTKKPASLTATVEINPRVPDPPGVGDVKIIDTGSKKKVVMKSGSRQIEHLAGTKWKKGVPKYNEALNVMIRFAADSNYGPSLAVPFTAGG